MNVAELLTRRAASRPQALAVVHGDLRLSYAEFDALVAALGGELQAGGAGMGDVIAVDLADPLLHLAANWALARIGAISIALQHGVASTHPAQELLQRAAATMVLSDNGTVWPGWRTLQLDLASVLQLRADPAAELQEVEPTALLHLKSSSGTTGRPKIVAATHAGMVVSIQREIDGIGYPEGEAYMTPVSMALDGPRRRYMACLSAGGIAVLPPPGGASAWIECIEREQVRHFSCVPSQAHALARALPAGQQRLPQLRCLRLSAGPSEASLHRLLRDRVCSRVWVSYGCSELGPMTVAAPELLAAEPQTVGRPLPGIEVQVVDAMRRLVPDGQVGEIRIRAAAMPSGYHDDPETSARAFDDGWFRPGDLGRIDHRGLLFHVGRADAMMVMDGLNIYPAEVEQALLQHSAVSDAVALPLKHPIVNDVPICAVALTAPDAASEVELLRHGRKLLGVRGPQRVAIVAAIPRTEHGKVQREALRHAALQALGIDPLQQAGAMRQRSFTLRLVFALPQALDLDRLDDWLATVLDTSSPRPARADRDSSPDASAQQWLGRVLLVWRWLLQGARLPVFDTPAVLACRAMPERKRGWMALATIARIDHIDADIYRIAFDAAAELCSAMLRQAPTDAGIARLHAQASQGAVRPLQARLRFGKSTLPVLRVAHRLSIPFSHLGSGVFQLGWGRLMRRLDRSVTDDDSAIGARLSNSKATTAALLRSAGLPAPRHQLVRSIDEARRAALQLGWPVVIKPADAERGEGVTVDVADDAALGGALQTALAASTTKQALVERQVDGVCHRLFIARGRLLYAVQRHPMSVVGDGEHDVAWLVATEAARQRRLPPWDRSGIEDLDALALDSLARAGLTTQSIPAAGTRVALRRIESTAWGGVDEDMTQAVHPANLQLALQAAELLGLRMAGIDIITTDISRPWFETGAVVNEVNFAPLLGGAAISLSHVPGFLQEFVAGNGKVAVEVFVGGPAAWQAACARRLALSEQGVAACLSSATRTLDAAGSTWPMAATGLYARTRALVLSRTVEALVLVVHDDELLGAGLPLETISALDIVDRDLTMAQSPGERLPVQRIEATLHQLQAWPRHVVAATLAP